MIARAEIQSALAEMLQKISDAALREKVVDVWMAGIARGGWKSLDELRAMPFTLAAEPRHQLHRAHAGRHSRRLGLAEAQTHSYAKLPYTIDFDRLIAGALLHDIGKLMEIQRLDDGRHGKSRAGMLARHPLSGAILAAEAGLPDEIINIIACHAKEGEGAPQVVETVFIHQADFATFDPLVMLAKGLLVQ